MYTEEEFRSRRRNCGVSLARTAQHRRLYWISKIEYKLWKIKVERYYSQWPSRKMKKLLASHIFAILWNIPKFNVGKVPQLRSITDRRFSEVKGKMGGYARNVTL